MRMYDIIRKKRDGLELTDDEIRTFITDYVNGEIPDYQAAALCMAIYLRGMTAEETLALTLAIRDSGARMDFSGINGIRVDKHSTGGVGDKTTLIAAPIVASLGVKVAKVSGRGLGHTGGTIDKLESISGFRTELTTEEFIKSVNEVGIAIIGQSAEIAPADKKLYALRDVTATVDCMPLIASSIMGKKLAADDDCIVLDVKTGSGSFMKTKDDSIALAKLMLDIGKGAGKKMRAVITNMDAPLGYAIGNALEVKEAIAVLNGGGPRDLKEVCIALAANMLYLAEYGDYSHCEELVANTIDTKAALDTFAKMVAAQGGNPDWIYDTSLFPTALYSRDVTAKSDGYITHVDAEAYGISSLILGAGRSTKDDIIDHSAGIMLTKKTGDGVKKGDVIATLYTNKDHSLDEAEAVLQDGTSIGAEPTKATPLIYDVLE